MLIVLTLVLGLLPPTSLLLTPLLVLGLTTAAFGMGTLLAALTVAYRDFRYVVPSWCSSGCSLRPPSIWTRRLWTPLADHPAAQPSLRPDPQLPVRALGRPLDTYALASR